MTPPYGTEGDVMCEVDQRDARRPRSSQPVVPYWLYLLIGFIVAGYFKMVQLFGQ